MASITYVFLMTILVTSQLNHADCQFSVLATGQVQIIKLLEEITTTSTPMVPNITALLTKQETLLVNTTTALNEMNTGQVQMVKLMEELTTSSTNHETLLNEMNTAVHQIAATQTRMAESLEQIVTLLQSRQSEEISPQPGQPTDAVPAPTVDTVTGIFPQPIQTTNAIPTPAVEKATSITPQPAQTTKAMPTTHDPTPQDRIFPTIDVPTDCSNISETDNQGSGVYTIDPRDGQGSFNVYCDMDTDEGGWTVFQNRFNGSVDFYLGWDDYETGFGNLHGEHWLGLLQIHRLTSSGQWTLRVDLTDFCEDTGYAQYDDFKIAGTDCKYKLSLGSFSGNISDSLSYHKGLRFATKDQANIPSGQNCALKHHGAWWYASCHKSNLNGLYKGSSLSVRSTSYMTWISFPIATRYEFLKKSEMKIRPTQ